MSFIHFEAKFFSIHSWNVIQLPKEASAKLPSRGMVMVNGTINNVSFQSELEPDGKGSHWFKVEETLQKKAHLKIGGSGELVIEPTKEWPEPKVPKDIKTALAVDAKAQTLWNNITPMARWDWIRWIRSTKNQETRKKRIGVAFSKLKKGDKRPCCFNRTLCTEPFVSHNGVLLDPQ